MADRYWVGGTANWDATAGTKWSTTSGGGGGAAVPGTADKAIFDGNSGAGTVTLNASVSVHSVDFTGFTGTFKCSATARTLTIGGAAQTTNTNLAIFNLGSTATFNTLSALTISIDTRAAGSNGLTITTNGSTFTNFVSLQTLANSASTVTLADSWDIGGANTNNVNFNRGTFIISSGKTFTCGNLSIAGTGVKGLTYSGATLNCTGWNVGGTVANFTITGDSSSNLNLDSMSNTSVWTPSTKSYPGTVTIADSRGAGGVGVTIGYGESYTNLRVLPTTYKTSNIIVGANITISGTLTLTGVSAGMRLAVSTNSEPTTRTLTAASVSLTNVDFRYITAGGASSPWNTGTVIGDGNFNTNITCFTSPVTRYWVGDTGNYSDTSHWSTSSGGSSGASVPLPQDSMIFDNNSFTGNTKTVTFDTPAPSGNIDATGVSSWTGIAINLNTTYSEHVGDLHFGKTTSANGVVFGKNGTQNFSMDASQSINNINMGASANTVVNCTSNIICSGNFIAGGTSSTFQTNNYIFTNQTFIMFGSGSYTGTFISTAFANTIVIQSGDNISFPNLDLKYIPSSSPGASTQIYLSGTFGCREFTLDLTNGGAVILGGPGSTTLIAEKIICLSSSTLNMGKISLSLPCNINVNTIITNGYALSFANSIIGWNIDRSTTGGDLEFDNVSFNSCTYVGGKKCYTLGSDLSSNSNITFTKRPYSPQFFNREVVKTTGPAMNRVSFR